MRHTNEGDRRKQEACANHEQAKPMLMRSLQRAIIALLNERREITADDLRERIDIPARVNPTVVGAAFVGLANARIIRRVRYEPTRRAIAHARPTAVWTIASEPAARAWLVNHPPIVPPPNIDDALSYQQTTMF